MRPAQTCMRDAPGRRGDPQEIDLNKPHLARDHDKGGKGRFGASAKGRAGHELGNGPGARRAPAAAGIARETDRRPRVPAQPPAEDTKTGAKRGYDDIPV